MVQSIGASQATDMTTLRRPAQTLVKTTNHTLDAEEARNRIIEVNSSNPVTITIPANATDPFEVGVIVGIFQYGTGTVTIAPASGVILLSPVNTTGSRTLAGRYVEASIRQRAVDEWVLAGSLT